VLLPAWIAAAADDTVKARAEALLGRVGLAGRAADPIQKLSGGEMQRVALCRALLRTPRLLLADEPTGSLDDENSALVMEQLLSLSSREGTTLIYVTHSADLAGLADETWTLHSGVLERPTEP
jgi:ABC-type lipoprotein export system ATPase subunit